MENKIQKLIEKYGVKNFLFTNKTETFYLTGAAFDGFWILVLNGDIHIICSKMIENQAANFFGGKYKIIAGAPFSKIVVETCKSATAAAAIKEIVIDTKYTSASDFLQLESKFKSESIALSKASSKALNIAFTAKTGVLDDLRIVKSASEIDNLKQACRIVSEVYDEIRAEVKAGMTELDIHYKILEMFAKRKVDPSFAPIVAAGANSANPHHASSSYKIAENDAVMIDMGCFYKGYASDLTRTFYLGKINEEFNKVWNTVKEAQKAVISAVKAGLPLSLADKTARDIIDSYGYKDNFIHTTGHGVGIEIHEMPSLAINAEGIFLAGMTVTIEPGIYINNKFGVRIEDTILVKDNGCEVLTERQ